MLKTAIKKLVNNKNLTYHDISNIVDEIAEGKASQGQIAAFITALKMKGETPDEITGLALKLREKALNIDLGEYDNLVDSCGTGGDHADTFNISTASAILASSSGLNIVKHSNFGFTSKCGSSNVIQALGLKLASNPFDVIQSLKNHNIAFLHAPYFHECLAVINPVRREIGIRTIFNFIGPLINPANPTGQVLGVSCPKIAPKIIETLSNIGCKKALVVNGQNPVMDEISVCGKTLIYKLKNGKIDYFEVCPEDFGIQSAKLEEIAGGTSDENAKTIEEIFTGKIADAKLNAVLLNSAAILWAGSQVANLEDGVKLAEELISSGKVAEKLSQLRS